MLKLKTKEIVFLHKFWRKRELFKVWKDEAVANEPECAAWDSRPNLAAVYRQSRWEWVVQNLLCSSLHHLCPVCPGQCHYCLGCPHHLAVQNHLCSEIQLFSKHRNFHFGSNVLSQKNIRLYAFTTDIFLESILNIDDKPHKLMLLVYFQMLLLPYLRLHYSSEQENSILRSRNINWKMKISSKHKPY